MQEIVLRVATTAATAFNSPPLVINDNALCFIQYLISGSDVVGTASLEASADNVTWTAYGSSTAVTASADGHFNVIDCGAKYIRFVWAYTSGTGNISVVANLKVRSVSPIAR